LRNRRAKVLQHCVVGVVAHVQVSPAAARPARWRLHVGLYKIFVYVEAVLHKSTILSFPPPTCIAHPAAVLLHDDWTVYDSLSDLPFVCYTPYNIGHNNIVSRPNDIAITNIVWCMG